MPVDETTGIYHPPTSPKQDYLREICRRKKYVLAAGCRFSTKTVGCLQVLAEYAWEHHPCNIAILTISQTVGYDSGIWRDLTEMILPDWIAGDFGMDWVKRPYIQGVSKKPTCEIRNKFGGVSVIQLESLQNEEEVEERFKPRRYGMIYVPELSTFKNRHTFDTLGECLRLLGLPSDQHLFLADTNPPEEGMNSWMYDVWFRLLDAEEADCDPREIPLKQQLARVDFDLSDNIFDTAQRIAELKARYAHDPDIYARYINGLWLESSEDSLFYKVFRPMVHVIGESGSKMNDNPEILVPDPGCHELLTGWDLGVSNSAAVIAEKVHRTAVVKGTDGKDIEIQVPVFKFLDELVILDSVFDMADFIREFMDKMDFWENLLRDRAVEAKLPPPKVMWRNWSDRSAFDWRDAEHNRYHHQVVYEASGGRIILSAAERGPGSVAQGVDLWKKLLYEDRLYFSKERCPKLIEMNKGLKRGTSSVAVIAKGSKHKHPFDAGRYLVASECTSELNRNLVNSLRKDRSGSTLVSVPV